MSEEEVPVNLKLVHAKKRAPNKKQELKIPNRITRCSLGENRCRACAKGMDHRNPPAYITCVYCNSIQNFFRLRTGAIRREKIYLEDANGERIMRYDADGNSIGYAWAHGDKMYYEDGTPVPETRRHITCGSDCCKFYKIPIEEVRKYKNLDKV